MELKDVYEVKWRDSRRYIQQMNINDEFCVTEIITVGHLIFEDKGQLVIAQDLIEDDVRGVISIPKENIISKKMLFYK